MKSLVEIRDGKVFTSSRSVAQKFKKNHFDVLKSLKSLDCSEDFSQSNFALAEYMDNQGKSRPEYAMTRDGFTFLVMGFTGKAAAQFKEEYIKAFNEAEQKLQTKVQPPNRKELAMWVVQLEEENERKSKQIELQGNELKLAAPKVEYYENVLQAENTWNSTTIAKELGMSAKAMNKRLHGMQVVFRQDQHWVLYAKYQNKGYTKTKTHNYVDNYGNLRTSIQTVWTERGREFLHSLFN